MKRFDLKQLLLCIATLVSSQFELAGVYPLIPAIFMTGFLSGVNRSLLFLCTMYLVSSTYNPFIYFRF